MYVRMGCLTWYIAMNGHQLAPPSSQPYSLIYRWRLEQEHSMKAKNGGRGMSDEQVERLVLSIRPSRHTKGYH